MLAFYKPYTNSVQPGLVSCSGRRFIYTETVGDSTRQRNYIVTIPSCKKVPRQLVYTPKDARKTSKKTGSKKTIR
jgi:hypothetical protein